MIHNLLREPLLRVSFGDGRRSSQTLPGALAGLAACEIVVGRRSEIDLRTANSKQLVKYDV